MAGSGIHTLHKQTQAQTLVPALHQSLKILQAPALELRSVILQELATNPVLEELPSENISLESVQQASQNDSADTQTGSNTEATTELHLGQDLSRLKELEANWEYEEAFYKPPAHTYGSEDSQYCLNALDNWVKESSLQEHLIEQIRFIDLSDAHKEAALYLIGSINDYGFISHPLKDLAKISKQPLNVLNKALKTLQTLDPPGIAAKDLQDCLLIQLKLRNLGTSLAANILQKHYALFLRRRIADIARLLDVSEHAVQEAFKVISNLDPAPGRKFCEDTNREVVADVIVEADQQQQWQVRLVDTYIPHLKLSPIYKNMLTDSRLSTHEIAYIREKIRSGKLIIEAISQRQSTLKLIAQAIVAAQRSFMQLGPQALLPLTLSHIAHVVGLHETTVSRAIANKFMQTPQGLFEFKYFFDSGFVSKAGQDVSSTSIKNLIKHLIEHENSNDPLSDQAICKLLEQKHLSIARRTVAKYREQLGIAPAHLRRHYA